MTFEGEHKLIPISGISRAGADTVCEDGSMNEVVGLELKDGSYVPYAGKITNASHFNGNIQSLYVHKTSKGINVIVKVGGLLYWINKETFDKGFDPDMGGFEEIVTDEEVKNVEFTGDAISMLSDNNTYTYVFNGDSYIKLENDFTPFNSNLLRFRVTRGIAGYDNVKDRDGNDMPPISVQYLSSKLYGAIGEKAVHIKERFDELVSASNDLSLGSSLITKASGMLTEKGGLQGYFLVCYAFRLTNGDIVQASMPMLMCPPCIKQGGNFSDPFVDERKTLFGFYRNSDQPKADGSSPSTTFSEIEISSPEADMWDSPMFGLSTGVTIDGKMVLSSKCENVELEGLCSDVMQFLYQTYYTKDKKWESVHGGSWGSSVKWFFPLCYNDKYDSVIDDYDEDNVSLDRLAATSTMPITSSITMHIRNGQIKGSGDDAFKYDDIYKTIACQGLSNKLQIAVDDLQPDSLPDTVSSVCIFISPEISPFSDLTNSSSVSVHGLFVGGKLGYTGTTTSNNVRLMHTFTPKYRSKELIADDIRNISSMYKVKEISREELVEMKKGEWIDVDLRGMLGDDLLVSESLPITAFDYTRYAAKTAFSYNYRLHIGDITRHLYDGYSRISLWNDYNNGRGQNCNVLNNDLRDTNNFMANIGKFGTRNIITVTYIRNEDSSVSKVIMNEGNLSGKTIWGLNRFIAFPNPNAYKMDVYNVNYVSGKYQYLKSTYNLIQNKKLGLSYYLDKNLGIFNSAGPAVDYVEVPENNARPARNIIRVSDVAAPNIIPARNIYTVGNGTILGFARINTALSDDTFGRNPLLIFATDGIYTMEVDSTGVGAYATSPNLFSNEICVNANSICEVAGGVIFASGKGLMVATSNGVVPFTPLLNGLPKHLPMEDDSYGIGLKTYNKMVEFNNLDSHISKNDFINFVKDANTKVVYIGLKNKLYIYNNGKGEIEASAYWVDIDTRVATKLTDVFDINDNDNSDVLFLKDGKPYRFEYLSSSSSKVLIQSRPIKIAKCLKSSIRVILRGRFHGANNSFGSLLVLGSIDGECWLPIGVQEKTLGDLVLHDIGCVTERVSYNYIMIIFTGDLQKDSHIDSIELTINNKYNNKLR